MNANRLINIPLVRGFDNGYGQHGSGVHLTAGTAANCAIRDNGTQASVFSGGIYRTGGDVRNSIVVFNTAVLGSNYSGAAANLTYSCTEPPLVGDYETHKNLAVDPLFVDPANSDFRLHKTSPAIDAGLDDLTWMASATDLGGSLRNLNKAVDMGACETLIPPSGTALLVR